MERLRTIFDGMFDGVWLIGSDSRTTYVDEAMAGLLGTTTEAMHGHPITEYLSEEYQATAEAMIGRQPVSRAERVDMRFLRADWVRSLDPGGSQPDRERRRFVRGVDAQCERRHREAGCPEPGHTEPEARGDRGVRRGHQPRLQQSPHVDPRIHGTCPCRAAGRRDSRRPRPGHRVGRPRPGDHRQAPRIYPRPGPPARRRRPGPGPPRHVADAALAPV